MDVEGLIAPKSLEVYHVFALRTRLRTVDNCRNMSDLLHRAVESVDDLTKEKEINNQTERLNESDPLYCEVCDVKVTSHQVLQRHRDGRKHRMKIERNGKTFICELCDIVANSELQLNIHFNSSKHKNRINRNEIAKFTNIRPNSTGILLILICIICVFINLLLLFKLIEI